MPRGVRTLPLRRGHVNPELGRDGMWLPVTHTHTQQDGLQVGLWFHYMRGCSDFAWAAGRTLLVRNKCHAAGVVEQRACNCSWSKAIERVAHKLTLAVQDSAFEPAWALWYEKAARHNTTNINVDDVRRALHQCAHGYSLPPNASSTVHYLLGHSALDYVVGATLTEGLRDSAAIDTIQMINQCARHDDNDCPGGGDAHVEVWDVRSFQLLRGNLSALRAQAVARRHGRRESMTTGARIRGDARRFSEALPRTPRLYRRLDGAQCNLSASWHHCVACDASQSELACTYRCHRGAGGKFWFNASDQYAHGIFPNSKDSSWLASLSSDANVLALAMVWRTSWGPLLGSVPLSADVDLAVAGQNGTQ